MATSLQRQLAALAAPASVLLKPERRRASIIFSPEEASKYDRDTFYKIGLDGLNELISICPDLFSPFAHSILFSEQSKHFERAVEDAETNKKVDKVIGKFLVSLSPYLMLKASLKCLEWLVHRFHIELFNIDSIMECILPFYDTKSFVMIIQTIKFTGSRDRATVDWEWLKPSIETGTPLRKSILYGNINGPFVLWLFQTLKKFIEVHRHHQDNLSTYLGFMLSTIVGVVTKFSREFSIKQQYKRIKSRRTVLDVVLNQIHGLFFDMMNERKYESIRRNREIYSVAYVMISTIGITAEENPEIGGILGSKIKRIFNLLLRNRDVVPLEETYLLIEMLVHHIYFEWMIKKKGLLKNILNDLSTVSRDWDVSKVVNRLFLANAKKGGKLTPSMLMDYLTVIQLSPETRAEILSKVYFVYKERRLGWAKTLLSRFEREYPCEFELASQNDPVFSKDLATVKTGKNFMLLVDHADEKLRAKAVRKLVLMGSKDTIKKGVSKKKAVRIKKSVLPDRNPIAQALVSRFYDESSLVVRALLKPNVNDLLKILSVDTLSDGYLTVLKNFPSLKPGRLAVKKLCLLAKKRKMEKSLENQILASIIPYLFPRKRSGVLTAMNIIKSPFAQKHNKVLQWFKSLNERDTNKISPEEVCSIAYKAFSTSTADDFCNFGSTNAVEISIAFLMLKSEEDLPRLLNSASSVGLISSSEFPITPNNFGQCLKSAETRNCVSIELILSSILNMKVTRFSTKLLVVKFVWDLSEKAINRGICMNFLNLFQEKIHPEHIYQFWFWLTTLIDVSTRREEVDEQKGEFYLIRCIQFFSSYVQEFGIPAHVGNNPKNTSNEQNSQEPDKPFTRSRGKVDEQYALALNASRSNPTRARNASGEGNDISPTWCLLEVLLSKCIQHTSHRVRLICMKFFEVIKDVPNLSFDWKDLVGKISNYRHEIVADSGQSASLVGRAIVDAKLEHVRSAIIKALSSPTTNRGIVAGLVNICQYSGSLMYSELEPMIKKLLETDPESDQLQALLNCFEATPQSVQIIPSLLENKGCAKIILKQLNHHFFAKAVKSFRVQLFSIMIDSAVTCKIPEIKLAIQRCVRKWEIDATIIAEELKKCIEAERRAAGTATRKTASVSEYEDSWKGRAEVILEFVQGMKNLINSKELLAPLFKILKICISLEEQSPVEYLKQLTLTALTLCCVEDSNEEVKGGSFQVELVIDCLRCSRNPQTHHHALILLNYAAKRFHEQVLHGVMSLFTFMGNSILRQDDTYSTQLIQQTVTTIIPALTNTAQSNEIKRTIVSGGIFRVFASALQDIPVHRRLPVLTSLVDTLNPEECLWQLLVIIVDNALNRDRKRSNLNADLELAVDLAWFYGHENVVKSLTCIYDFFISMSSTVFKNSISDQELRALKIDQSPLDKAVLDFSRKDCFRDIQIVVYYSMELVMKIASKFQEADQVEDIEYEKLLERCLSFSKIVSGLTEDKIFRLITQRNFEVIEKVNQVLQAEDFVRVISIILERNEVSIKRKILDMFNLRLVQKVEWFGDLKILLPLLQPLLKVAQMNPISDDVVTLVQTSFLSMKLIAKHLAFTSPEDFIDVFRVTLSYTTHENHLLCASALLCLGELFCLKSLLLPKLNDVTSGILRAFKASSKLQKLGKEMQQKGIDQEETAKNLDSSDTEHLATRLDGDASLTAAHLLCISTITCMNKMVEQLGPLMGAKFLKKSLILLLTLDSQLASIDSSSPRKKTFDQRLRVLLKTIATKIPVRNSLIPLKGAFNSLLGKPQAIKAIMLTLKDALQATSKSDFALILPSLCDSFIEEFFACRYNQSADNTECVDENEVRIMEDAIIDCLITGAVLKMSESTFRPYYHKLFDWARGSSTKLITFFRFSAMAAERLKSLFVTFAGYVMNESVECLNKNVELNRGILSFFYHLFSNDREGFVTTDRFNALVKPLVDMIESEQVLGGDIELKLVSDCLIQLAVASNDLNRWQHMIDLVSTKANHGDKKVRLNVIFIFEAAASELGKDFLPLLPPIVPFLAELMNDDEPDVESATQKMLLKLETIVGEPLQSYFT